MKLELVSPSDPILYQKSEIVNPRLSDKWNNIINEMFVIMEENKGIGLAAPQVGISARLFILNIENNKMVCFNPRILSMSEETDVYEEGCLSFPDEQVLIERPIKIRVTYQNVSGTKRTSTLRGIKARAFQHELDHLNGVTFLQRGRDNG
jgi:peptide deformylase